MSMDEPASGHEMRDADMSEAVADDPELALGEFSTLYERYFIRVLMQSLSD